MSLDADNADDLALPCEHKFRLAKFVCWTTGASWPHDVAQNILLESGVEFGVYFLPRETVKAVCGVCEDVASDVVKKLSGKFASIVGSEAVNSTPAAEQSETQQQAHKLLTRLLMRTPYLSTEQMRKKKFIKKLKFRKKHSHWPPGPMTNSSTLSESIDAVARHRNRVTFDDSTLTTTNNRRYFICGGVKYSPTVVEQTLTANPSMSLREVATLLCMNLSTLSKIMLTHKLSRIDELKSRVHVFATCRLKNIEQQSQHHSTSNDDDYGNTSSTSSLSENTAERTLQTKFAIERRWMNSIGAVVDRETREDEAFDAEIVALDQSSNSNDVEKRTAKAAGDPEYTAETDAVIDNVDADDVRKLPLTARRIHRLLQAPESMSHSQIATVLKVSRNRVQGLISTHKLRRTRPASSFSDIPLAKRFFRTKNSKINLSNGIDAPLTSSSDSPLGVRTIKSKLNFNIKKRNRHHL